MFESLSDRLQDVFERLRGKGRLTEQDVDEALKEVRRALLAADVNFKVAKGFNDRIRDRRR
jgi:signal recognition particle subunit SRP54